jgi:hypothetical protein
VGAVGAHALEAAQGQLRGHLGVNGGQRLVAACVDHELVRERLGIREAQARLIALHRDALGGQTRGPEGERILRADSVHDAMDHPGAGPAGARVGVLEEGEVGAGAGELVAVEEVVDAGIVLVDGLRDEPHAEDAGVEVDVAAGVAGDRADVVDAFELHSC